MLVDSTFLIDLLHEDKGAVSFVVAHQDVPFFTTEINVFELVSGVYATKINTQKHLEQAFALLSRIIILPLDRKATLQAGKIAGELIQQGQRIEDADCLIAGISLSNGLREIVTRNKDHFERIKEVKVVAY